MLQAIISFLIVFICGYFGVFLGTDGGIITGIAAATACVVYAIKGKRP